MSTYKSIYRSGIFWEAAASRALRTFGQVGAGALTAAAFTGEGIIPFLIVIAVAVVGSVLSSIATPGKIVAEAPDEYDPSGELDVSS